MQAAVDQMRRVFNAIDMDGVVVIGEGEKDEVPLLSNPHVLQYDILLPLQLSYWLSMS